MPAVLAVAAAGLAAGAIHVLMGADHLAVVAPLAARSRPGRAWSAGFRWGLGHAGGVGIVAVVAMTLREAVPIETVSHWSERIVGATLIAIGVWALAAVARSLHGRRIAHGQIHRHQDLLHGREHAHRHGPERAALAVGLLHGTAGAAHVLGILPALALPSALAATSYLIAFGAGTVAAMSVYAALIGAMERRFAYAGDNAWAGMMGTCGAASVVVGALWLLS